MSDAISAAEQFLAVKAAQRAACVRLFLVSNDLATAVMLGKIVAIVAGRSPLGY